MQRALVDASREMWQLLERGSNELVVEQQRVDRERAEFEERVNTLMRRYEDLLSAPDGPAGLQQWRRDMRGSLDPSADHGFRPRRLAPRHRRQLEENTLSNDIINAYITSKAQERGFRRPELAADLLRGQKLHTAADVEQALAQLEQRHGDALVAPKTSEEAPPSEAERLHQLVANRPHTPAEHDALIREQARRVEAERLWNVINEARDRERGLRP